MLFRSRSRPTVATFVAPLALAVVGALGFGLGTPASGAPSGDRRSELARQIGEASRAEAARLDALYVQLQGEVDATQAELDAATIEFNDEAAGLYRSARRGSNYDVVLAARPSNVVKQNKYLDQVTAQQRRVVRRIARLRADLETKRRDRKSVV